MSNLLILGDAVIYDILINLTKNEILSLQRQLLESLRDFSVGDERKYQVSTSVSARPNGDRTLFRPFTSPTSVGVKIIVSPNVGVQSKLDSTQSTRKRILQGIVALCDNEGNPTGIINGKEITGYRTSLNALIGYVRRRKTSKIVVFGAGKCVVWHIRIALALRGSEIRQITVINRTKQTACSMIDRIQGENQKHWQSAATITYFEPDEGNYNQALEHLLQAADVVFCTVQSMKPLFPAEYVTQEVEVYQGPYISAVGSWQPDLIEHDPALWQYIANWSEGYNPRSGRGGAVIVDDREKVIEESGEAIRSKVKAANIVEWGEILDLETRLQAEGSISEHEKLKHWLEEGFVVYKSIGVSITDLVAGNFLLSIAKRRNLGVSVPDF